MSVVDAPGAVLDRHRHRPLVAVALERPWLAGAVLAKAADVATTLVGLSLLTGLREASPLAAAAIEAVGLVPAIGGLALGALALLGGCLIGGGAIARRLWSPRWARWYRRATCALLGLAWCIAAANNTIHILGRLTA